MKNEFLKIRKLRPGKKVIKGKLIKPVLKPCTRQLRKRDRELKRDRQRLENADLPFMLGNSTQTN